MPEVARRSPSPSRLEAQNSMPQRDAWLKPPKKHIRALSGRSATDGNLRKAEKHFQDDPEPIIVDYTLEVYEICRQFLTFAVMRSKSLDIVRCFAPILGSIIRATKPYSLRYQPHRFGQSNHATSHLSEGAWSRPGHFNKRVLPPHRF
jgi:hypothetical protein